ncbi:PREDICTED: abscisic acid 8'-hydroxylase 1-like [Fragaria vesca subsp. vesca]|uniref:abscisic acid 8'-hydroxylase 1-like n=1 Tax=Fragaria vesca subsp. vesca TaxID=101020 RepID=UPI0002C34AD4|nr:PREDICTED: abscisic acid 8'-hydroxylase 1-like [Fragaria vesca subsp. vesca]
MLCAISKEEFLFLVKKHYDVLIVALLFSIGVAFFVSKLAWRKATASSRGYIPGRLGLPFIGETVPFLSAVKSTGGCYEFIRLRRIRYGKWFKTRVFGKIHVFVPSTDGARMILSNDFVKFNKGYMKALLDCIGDKSLFTVSHENHKRIRDLLSDLFSMNSLSSFIEKFDKMLCQRLKKLEQGGKSFSVFDFSMKMAFDSMCCMLMSITDEALLRQLEKDITAVSNAIFSAPIMIPGTKYYKGIKARRRIMEIFKDMIARRRSGEEWPEPEDFLQSLLRRDSYHPDEKLQDPEIMDNLMTLLISGQATTSATQMWSVKFLDENQQVQDILRKEVLSIARSKPEGASVTLEDINRMPYCWKVLKETMRISSVVMWYPRVALADCTIEGFEIKKGWHVNVDAKCIHNDPELYPDPSKFNPSRFDELLKPYSFIPFASGPRTCLGINMAKMTMMVFLYRLTSAYSWTVDDLDTSLQENAHFPRLRSGCPITLNPL